MSSYRQIVISSYRHIVISSNRHIAISSYIIISWTRHIVTSSCIVCNSGCSEIIVVYHHPLLLFRISNLLTDPPSIKIFRPIVPEAACSKSRPLHTQKVWSLTQDPPDPPAADGQLLMNHCRSSARISGMVHYTQALIRS